MNEQSDNVCTCQCHLDPNKNTIFIELCTISLITSTGDERRAESASSDELLLSVSSQTVLINFYREKELSATFQVSQTFFVSYKVCVTRFVLTIVLELTITIKALIAHFHSNRMVHFVLQFKLRQDLTFCMKDAPIMRDVI